MSYPLDTEETLAVLQRQLGETERSHGFREDWELASKLEEMADELAIDPQDLNTEFQDDAIPVLRQAAKALRANIIGTKMMLVVSELGEALESLRHTGPDNLEAGNVDEEYADAIIRLLSNADMLKLNVPGALVAKAKKNNSRPHKHGKQM